MSSFTDSATADFFRARLDHMIDLRHELAVLTSRMPWQPEFDTKRCKSLIHIDHAFKLPLQQAHLRVDHRPLDTQCLQ